MISETEEALKNKGYEFPRTHTIPNERWFYKWKRCFFADFLRFSCSRCSYKNDCRLKNSRELRFNLCKTQPQIYLKFLLPSSGCLRSTSMACSLRKATGSFASLATAIPPAAIDNDISSGFESLAYFRNERIAKSLWFLVDADTIRSCSR